MRVAILIVRMVGIIMILMGGLTVYGAHKTPGIVLGAGNARAEEQSKEINDSMNEFNRQAAMPGYVILAVGLAFTLFSARICTLLTFDYKG